jgi:hypothetical protein
MVTPLCRLTDEVLAVCCADIRARGPRRFVAASLVDCNEREENTIPVRTFRRSHPCGRLVASLSDGAPGVQRNEQTRTDHEEGDQREDGRSV